MRALSFKAQKLSRFAAEQIVLSWVDPQKNAFPSLLQRPNESGCLSVLSGSIKSV
jgi:hypothetical protein